jgi:hypothetical protein
MVDINVEGIDKLRQQAVDAYKQLEDKAKSITFDAIAGTLGNVTDALRKTIGTTAELRSNTIGVTSQFDNLARSMSTVIALTTKFDAFKNLQVQGGSAVETMGSQFDELIGRFGGWEQASKKMLGAGLGHIVAMGKDGARAFLESASSAQKLEMAHIGLLAATGQLNTVFDSNNNLVGNLNGQVARYGSLLADTSSITRENIKVVSDYAAQLGTIPNVVGTLVDTGRGYEDGLDGLAAAMTVARGAGRDYQEILKVLNTAYENIGNAQGPVTDNAQKGIQAFALMSEASNKLGLRFSDTQGFLEHVADSFKMIGNNTEGATNILARFSGALQNTGLTAKQSVDVVKTMVDSIKNLEIGTKALISVRSGGPGGLQGAFKVENMLREGKTDEVAKMLERSFKQQVGGRIVTQKEAEGSPQAAAQFMRQRELLKSGAFGGLAKDNDSATRLLEAIAKGPVETANALNAKDATKTVVEKGNEFQKQQVNLLDSLNNSLDRSVMIQEQSFLATARSAIGTGDKASIWTQALEQFKLTSQKDVISNFSDINKKEPLNFDAQQKLQNRIAGANMIDSVDVLPQVKNVGQKTYNDAKSAVQKMISDVQKQSQETDNTAMVKRGQNDTMRATQRAQAETLRQRPSSLATEIPKATQTVKHQVDMKPLEVNISVTRDKGMEVNTTTNYQNTTVRDLVNQSSKGYNEFER